MLLTITSTHSPATDLGYLLYKNPARTHSFELPFGHVHVFYPEATPERCTAAMLLDVDPIGLVRGRRGPPGEGRMLEQYVNDRPYVASSFLSVAISRVYDSALAGKSKERPQLVNVPLPLEAKISVLPCRGGEEFLRRLFEPLGYTVTAQGYPLDEQHPDWGASPYFSVTLAAQKRLSELLTHLYVLIPVLDNDKHYWVGDDEVEKLLRHGEGWLGAHPERQLIAKRYLKHQRSLVAEALSRLTEGDCVEPDSTEQVRALEEASLEQPIRLNELRLQAVVSALKEHGAKRVLDLGCGEGHLLRTLLSEKQFDEIVGFDVSYRVLEMAKERLRLERLAPMQRERIKLIHGALTYRDKRLTGYDAAAVIEVIEHLDQQRLAVFERVLFEFARPMMVVITTPNAAYNVKFDRLPAGRFRHRDHRFEWTRKEFGSWAQNVADRFEYHVQFLPIGPEDPVVGTPTQMGVFTR